MQLRDVQYSERVPHAPATMLATDLVRMPTLCNARYSYLECHVLVHRHYALPRY